jgi:tetratricopeptide (TPR) repeat protein
MPAAPPRVKLRRHAAVAAVLLTLTVLAYSNSFRCEWVGDGRAIIQQGSLMRASTWEDSENPGIKRIFTEDYWFPRLSTGLYRPVTNLTYWLNWRWSCGGDQAETCEASVVGFHVVNLVLHWANACLVYLLALRIVGSFWTAAFSAALFAVHPIATEAVTNVVGRADLLAGLGVLAGLLLYIQSTSSSSPRKAILVPGAMLMTAVAVFSKENGVVVIAAVVCYDAIYRWLPLADWRQRGREIVGSWVGYAALLLPLAMLFVMRRAVFAGADKPPVIAGFLDNPIHGQPYFLGRVTAMRVAAEQFWRLVWPQYLSYDYSYNQIPLFRGDFSESPDSQTLLMAAALVVVLLATVTCCWRNRVVMFCLAFAAVSYLPTSNLLIDIGSIAAERFMYLPLAPFSILLAMAAESLAPWRRFAPHAIVGTLLLAFGLRTFNRNFDWQNEVTISSSAVNTVPASFKPYTALAEELYLQDPLANVDQAIELGEKSVQVLDGLPDELNVVFPYVRLGGYYLSKGIFLSHVNPDGSRTVTEAALPYFRQSAMTLQRAIPIDLAHSELNRRREVERGTRADQVPDTGTAGLYLNLAEALQRLDRTDQAIVSIRYARHLTPTDITPWYKLAVLQLQTGRAEDACVTLIECLVLQPDHGQAWPLVEQAYHQLDTGPLRAVQLEQGVRRLNLENPLVQRHFREAYQDLVRTYRQAQRLQIAEALRTAAVEQQGLPAELFEPRPEDDSPPRPPEGLPAAGKTN